MNASLHARLDPDALAEAAQHLSGRFDAAGLDARLAQALDMGAVAGEVRYELDFERLANGETGLSGSLRARLRARCQRCLEPFDLVVEASPHAQISGADDAAPQEGWDPGGDDPAPTLAALIEDELLLALPLAPRHSGRDCPAIGSVDAPPRADTQRPFSGLGEVLAGGRETDNREAD